MIEKLIKPEIDGHPAYKEGKMIITRVGPSQDWFTLQMDSGRCIAFMINLDQSVRIIVQKSARVVLKDATIEKDGLTILRADADSISERYFSPNGAELNYTKYLKHLGSN